MSSTCVTESQSRRQGVISRQGVRSSGQNKDQNETGEEGRDLHGKGPEDVPGGTTEFGRVPPYAHVSVLTRVWRRKKRGPVKECTVALRGYGVTHSKGVPTQTNRTLD